MNIPPQEIVVVAVKKEQEDKLFKFFQIDSYINNEDEDVKVYLELYGIIR